ncbi:hypothetical protein [Desulfosporosinus sp.]|uniref:hypothetical protein n=1 Tax=Desulfosporosinus sp. TaxID=157907 RepID=UPI002621F73F|nr:hypothetical protein [Desulfosporosinus sp.]
MRKTLFTGIIIALFVVGLFLTKAFAGSSFWEYDVNSSSFQADSNSFSSTVPNQLITEASQSVNPDESESWYSPMNQNYHRKDYYWYRNAHDDSWSNAIRNWCCQ